GLRPDGGKLLSGLVRQSLDPRIVETLRKRETFVPPESLDVGRLAAQVDMIFGIDLELLEDPRGEVAEARPDPPNHIDPDGGKRQEVESAATLAVPVQGEPISIGFVRRERHGSSKIRGG